MTLTEFLTARLDEDEAVARAAIPNTGATLREFTPPRDAPPYAEWVEVPGDGVWQAHECVVDGIGFTIYDEGGHGPEEAKHIARHDPAHVLREVEAKRAIVALHSPYHVTTSHDGLEWDFRGCGACDEPDDWRPEMGDWWPCDTLLALAAVYADHEDFQEEWRP